MWDYLNDLFTIGENEVQNNPLYNEITSNIPNDPRVQISLARARATLERALDELKDGLGIGKDENEPQSNILLWILGGLIVYKVTK
tara:strand:- start:439 stop:696 length:258 start_codon:yes stop_codon:yes gene_type:complete